MKRVSAVFILICIFLTGCAVRFPIPGEHDDGESALQGTEDVFDVGEADSVVTLDIYPYNCRDTLIGKFDRYQYKCLSDEQKRIYILLDNAIYTMKTGNVGLGECDPDDVTVAYYALRSDRPEYFWIPTKYVYQYTGDSMSVCFAEDMSEWLCSPADRERYEDAVRGFIGKYIEGQNMAAGDYEKELSAHDAVAAAVTYDHGAAEDIGKHLRAGTVVGSFVDGSAVCTGYAKAMQMLCFALDIDCITVTGTTVEPHMWNCVNIDGIWYHVDVTADDSSDSNGHSFFNVTDEYIKLGCRVDPDFGDTSNGGGNDGSFNMNIPECNKTDANYYHINSLYITNVSQARPTLISEVCAAVRSGKNRAELCFDPSVGFVAGTTPYNRFIDIEECLITANSELPDDRRIKKYSVLALDRSTCITVEWE